MAYGMAYGNYMYKIQWLFQNKTDAKKVIRAIGSKSLDVIYFRNWDLKIVDSYNGMTMFPYGLADEKAIQEIDRKMKNNPDIRYIELLRK